MRSPQKKSEQKNIFFRRISALFLLGIVIIRFYTIITPHIHRYLEPSYTEEHYKFLEQLFNASQYRVKDKPGIIPDEIVFSYAAGAYLRGIDPIYINSEHTPLGKYLIGLGIVFMKNDAIVIPLSAALTLLAIFLVSKTVLKSAALAMLPVIGFSFERIFTDQLAVVPLLDIIQLPFILLTLFAFTKEEKSGTFIWTSVLLGITAATKTIVPSILLFGIFVLYLTLRQKIRTILRLIVYLPICGAIFFLSYIKTFIDGYTLMEFFRFQKWIFLYQKSKFIFPFSVWRFIYRNQWQTWWGDMGFLKGEDWQITWPIITTIPILGTLWYAMKGYFFTSYRGLLLLYIGIWLAFLSAGVVSSRFFLPLFPVCYIISIDIIVGCIAYLRRRSEKYFR